MFGFLFNVCSNLHSKTFKNITNYTELGGCRLSIRVGVFTPPPRKNYKISLSTAYKLSTVQLLSHTLNRFTLIVTEHTTVVLTPDRGGEGGGAILTLPVLQALLHI